ncbi:MAG: hypothetical protein COT74_03380 [Bdellovibrionales bacterium CG10_big_fil_rev_8_21_14_0_10_45_34]|nr:MAG: hypothetical protein COT74_03380 [Bdellovibrionales bacterium CG10_big_fil_rev_8_21_14_0_10_45_34]
MVRHTDRILKTLALETLSQGEFAKNGEAQHRQIARLHSLIFASTFVAILAATTLFNGVAHSQSSIKDDSPNKSSQSDSQAKGISEQNAMGRSESGASSISVKKAASEVDTKVFSALLSYTFESNLASTSDSKRSQASVFRGLFSANFQEAGTLIALTSIQRMHVKPEDTIIGNTALFYQVDLMSVRSDLDFFVGALAVAPTNEVSREKDSYQGAAGVAPGIRHSQNFLGVKSSVSLSYNYLRYFHGYTLNSEAVPNIQYSHGPELLFAGAYKESVSFLFNAQLLNGTTYRGLTKQSYQLLSLIQYHLGEKSRLIFRYENGGNLLRRNGRDSNFSFFDQQDTLFGLGLGLQI